MFQPPTQFKTPAIIAVSESDHPPPQEGPITTMGRSISPLLRRELANLDDAGSRHSAMEALKSYVRDLDSKDIPRFLAEVSETKEPGSSPGECSISVYEVLARVHGPKIVPQIDNIMSTIMRTLSSRAGSFPLYQACSRVVPAIARYAIEPSIPGEEKTRIIHSLYKPLCDALMGLQESVSSGAALCLKAVVQADNWRFASDAMVNKICLKVASALEEKATQTNYHMGLVMALVKHNTLIAEPYARSFLRSGLGILSTGITESNTQKRLLAIQMINSLLHCVDSRSISSELEKVVDAMEKCRTDRFQFVRVAAGETLQIAKSIASQKGFDRRNGKSTPEATDTESTGDGVDFRSPESHTVESFFGYDVFAESPKSIGQSSANFEYARRTDRRLWDSGNGGVDVSLEDGISRRLNSGGENSETDLEQHMNDEQREAFAGFGQSRAVCEGRRSNTSSPPPQRPQSQLSIDGVKICSTPRKLVRSLQESTCSNSRDSIRGSPALDEVEQNTKVATYGTAYSHNLISDVKARRNIEKMGMGDTENSVDDSDVILGSSESVSATDDLPGNCAGEVSCRACEEKNVVSRKSTRRVMFRKISLGLTIAFLLLAAILSYMRIDDEEIYLLLLAAILSYICNLNSANQNSEQITECVGVSFWFQRPQSQLTIDGVKICSTPRKLVRSLQEPTYSNSRDSIRRSPALDEVEQNTKVATYGTAYSHNLMSDVNARRNIEKMGMRDTENSVDDSEVILDSSESVSSTDDLPGNCDGEVSCEEKNVVSRKSTWRVMFRKTTLGLTIALLLLAAICSYMRIDDEEIYLIPT